jgi:NADH-quinone oxidoreductase subunit N
MLAQAAGDAGAALGTAAEFVGPKVDWFALSPLLVLIGGGLLLMVAAALTGRWFKGAYATVTAVIAAGAGTLAIVLWHRVHDKGPINLVKGAAALDGFGLFIILIICSSVLLTALFLDSYLRREALDGVELYALLLMSAAGGVIMAMATDMVVLFLGLEILSIALYVMAASHLKRIDSQESAMKYFVLGGFSSAFLLYGVALVYGATGSTNFHKISAFLQRNVILDNGLLMAGLALLLVGLGFKVAAAPFHSWTPDVYQGAPSPVTGFMASAAKAAAFAALLRAFVILFATQARDWRPPVLVLTVLTLIVGSFLAVVQTNVKRMLAYSSVSHAGFMLVGVHAATPKGTAGTLFYLFTYAIVVLGSFGCIMLIGRTGDADHRLSAYRGLAKEKPYLALVFAIFLLAQAGTPLTSGFIAKLAVIRAAADNHSYTLAVTAMLCAVVSAFLYLRIVVSMFMADAEAVDEAREKINVPFSAALGLGVALVFTVLVGVFPGPLLDLARHALPIALGQ